MIPFIWNFRKGRTIVTESRSALRIGEGIKCKRHENIFKDEGTLLYLDCGAGYKTIP